MGSWVISVTLQARYQPATRYRMLRMAWCEQPGDVACRFKQPSEVEFVHRPDARNESNERNESNGVDDALVLSLLQDV